MTLRKKTFIIVSLTFLGLAIVLSLSSYRLLLGGIDEIEIVETRTDLERAVASLRNEQAVMEAAAVAYAKWDDMFAFVNNRNHHFIVSNFQNASLSNLKINFLIISDTAGHIVYATGFDLQKQRKVPLFQSIGQLHKTINDYYVPKKSSPGGGGILFLPNGLAMIAVKPILSSNGKGKPQGMFIIGSFLYDNEIKALGELLKLDLALFHKEQKGLPPDVERESQELSPEDNFHIKTLDTRNIAGYALLPDFFGKHSFILRIKEGRPINKQGMTVIAYTLAFVLFAGLVFTAVMMIIMEKSVLRRVLRISHDVRAIESEGNTARRIQLNGNDELGSLSQDINSMLDKLELSEKRIRDEAEKYRAVIEDQTEFICRFGEDGALTFVNEAYYRFFSRKRRAMIGRHFLSFVPDEDRSRINASIMALTQANAVTSYDNRVILSAGEEYWQHWTCRAIYDETGKLLEYQAVGRDITDRKQTEEELICLNNKLEEANAQLGMAYANLKNNLDKLRKHLFKEEFAFLVDRDGSIFGITERVLEYLRLSRSETLGANICDYVPAQERGEVIEIIRDAWIGITRQSYIKLIQPQGAAEGSNLEVKRIRPQEESNSQVFEVKLARLTLEGKRLLLVTLR